MATTPDAGDSVAEPSSHSERLVRERQAPAPARPLLPRVLLAASLSALLVLAVAGGLLWSSLRQRGVTGAPLAPWTTIPALTLSAPLDGPTAVSGPWARLRLEPARAGDNRILAATGGGPGTPTPADGTTATVTGVELEPLTGGADAVAIPAAAFAAAPAPVELGETGWWRATVAAAGGDGGERAAAFYLLLPDPNVNGPEAVPEYDSGEAAAALFERALAGQTALHRVRFRQTIGDGLGHLAIADQAVNDGADGSPPAYSLEVPGSTSAYVVGRQRWTRRNPEDSWQIDNSGVVVPPRDWGETYAGATNFRLGVVEEVDGEASQVVSFVVPTTDQPLRQEVAWYAWWIGLETGRLHRETMVSRSHYMLNEFRDFDAPLAIAPPDAVAPAASPLAAATPSA